VSYIFDQELAKRYGATSTGTSSGASAVSPNRTVTMTFDQFEIVLAVTEENRVLGILEVRQKADFRDVRQRVASTKHFDMELERFVTP
jgi:hypothetical protein